MRAQILINYQFLRTFSLIEFKLIEGVADGMYPGLMHLAQEYFSHLGETVCLFILMVILLPSLH